MNRISLWVNEYTDSLYDWALFKTSDSFIAEELVQETFIAAFNSLEKFNEKSHPRTWLFGILNHKILDHYRSSNKNNETTFTQHHLETSDDDMSIFFDKKEHWELSLKFKQWTESDQELLDNPEFCEILSKCISNLKADSQAIIRLKFVDGEKSEIICQDLGITPTNLWQIIHRSKLQLRKCLDLHWFK